MATVKFYNYARVFKSQTEYARRMKFLSDSIFGEVRRPTSKESMAVVTKMSRKPYEMRKEIVEYYPAHEHTTKLLANLRAYGLYRDEHADFKEEMAKKRRLKGLEKKFGLRWRSKGRTAGLRAELRRPPNRGLKGIKISYRADYSIR